MTGQMSKLPLAISILLIGSVLFCLLLKVAMHALGTFIQQTDRQKKEMSAAWQLRVIVAEVVAVFFTFLSVVVHMPPISNQHMTSRDLYITVIVNCAAIILFVTRERLICSAIWAKEKDAAK